MVSVNKRMKKKTIHPDAPLKITVSAKEYYLFSFLNMIYDILS